MMPPEPLLRTEDHVILDIADMIRRDGNRLYSGADVAYHASLCGLTAGFASNGDVMVIKGVDVHIDITLSIVPVDDNDGIEHYKNERTDVKAKYLSGDIHALRAWHKHLCAYRRSMRPGHSSAVA